MSKQILVLVVLLAPSASLAADDAPPPPRDGSEKEICSILGSRASCERASSVCYWDAEDAICEIRQRPPRCDLIADQATCSAQPRCSWDKDDPLGPRCEDLS
jgi:hypothetical protein